MRLSEQAEALIARLEALDVGVVEPEDCAAVVVVLARLERVCRVRKAQAAIRATMGATRGRDGSPDAAHWLAEHSGESVGAARAAIDTATALDDCPATKAAVERGELSLAQAKEITAAERANPGSEGELVALARRAPMSALRDEARRKRHEAIDTAELHRHQRAARRFRWWRNDIGNIAFAGELPPADGVPFVNRLDADVDRRWRRARKAATTHHSDLEARDAYAADALTALVRGQGRGRATRADMVIVIDLRAWRRGQAEGDEACHIIGGGHIPIPVARELAVDAFFKAVIHDGENILTLAHLGRRMKAELRTALDLGPPPTLDGTTCCEAGCGRRHGLQWDHVHPVASDGPTSYANLKPRCIPHHQAKTERDRLAGLLHHSTRRRIDQTESP